MFLLVKNFISTIEFMFEIFQKKIYKSKNTFAILRGQKYFFAVAKMLFCHWTWQFQLR